MRNLIALLAAAGMIALAGAASAAGKSDASEKELCLLYARDCADKLYNLQEKIKKIQGEIARGETVYSTEELKRLKEKLKEAEDMMNKLTPAPSPSTVTK